MDHPVTHGMPTPSEATKSVAKPRNRRTQHPDRVWINGEALARLNGWIAYVGDQARGVKLTRSDLVNFLILSHAEVLTAGELDEIKARHFDALKQAQWAQAQLQAALARGEKVTLLDILLKTGERNTRASRIRTRKAIAQKNSENADKNTQKQSLSADQESLISVENSAGE